MTVSGRTWQKHLAIAQSPTRATEESAGCDVHEVHNPPGEVDLDEIYYYRIRRPEGYAHQRLYSSDGTRETVVTARDGDAVLVRDGYHPVVAGHGYDVYYLNFLAGSARSLANTVDPAHAWVMSTWAGPSPTAAIVPMGSVAKTS